MQFNVRAFNNSSSAIAERIVAGANIDVVRQQFEQEGWTVLSICAIEPAIAKKRKAFNLVLFCEELRTLLCSGMSLVEAVDALGSRQCDETKYGVLLEMKQHLLEGKSFSSALELNQFSFPALLIASVRASERTSRLNDALDEFIAYEKVGLEFKKKLISAMIYPSLVVGFGLLVSLFMISYVVPRFSKVYEDFRQTLSLSTRLLMQLGQFAEDKFMYLASAVTVLTGIVIFLFLNGQLRKAILAVVGKLYFTRHYVRLYQLARIYQTMAVLVKGGYALADAIPLASNLAFDAALRTQLASAHRAISEGRRLSNAFADNALTDSVTERLLQVGERSGNLAKILNIIAQTYQQEFSLFIERTSRLVEPILLMAVGLLTGTIIVLMYMPVFDLAGGI